jgi:hypothetical protein
MALPPRTADTMSDAISLSSPNGHMSNRAKTAAQEALRIALFGKEGLTAPGLPHQPTKQEKLRQQAKHLRELADRGMRPRAFRRDAAKIESEADAMDAA